MKKYISGLITGLILSLTITAFANSEVVAKYTNFNFVVNGETKQLSTQPLVVDGTSYLPVRDIAGILGYEVNYIAESKTIELSNSNDNKIDTPSNNTGAKDANLKDIISLRELRNYGIKTIVENNMLILKKSDIAVTMETPILDNNIEEQFNTNYGIVTVGHKEGSTYFYIDDLREIGLLD